MHNYTAVVEHCTDTDLYVGYILGFTGAPEFVNENETRMLDDYAAFSSGLLIHAASGISGG